MPLRNLYSFEHGFSPPPPFLRMLKETAELLKKDIPLTALAAQFLKCIA